MCEMTVRLQKNNTLKDLAHDVARFKVEKNGLHCFMPLGDEIFLENMELLEADLLGHQLIVVEKSER